MEAGNGPSSAEFDFLSFFVEPKLFVETSVTEFIWGYEDPILMACSYVGSDACSSTETGLMLGVSPIY